VRGRSRYWTANLSCPASRLITAGVYLLTYLLVMTDVQASHSCSRCGDDESEEKGEEAEGEQVESEQAEGEQADGEESDEETHPGTMQ